MVLEIVNREKDNYKRYLDNPGYDELYKWEALEHYKNNWNIEAVDFSSMYDNSLQNKVSDNLWASRFFYPKQVMLQFIKHDKEKVREMFKQLFDEQIEINKRMEEFMYDCEQIRKEIDTSETPVQNHFHEGGRILSLYLAFQYPMKYAIYKFTEFKVFMELVRATNKPGTGEYSRFFKVINTIYNILQQDQELMDLHKSKLENDSYKGETLMIAQDFIFITARNHMKMTGK